MENLGRYSSRKTMIFIAHREKVAAYCDRTLRLG